MKMIKKWCYVFCFACFVLLNSGQASGQIGNIDDFLEKCPTDDPAFPVIINDFKIRRNGVPVTQFTCNAPISELSISEWTDELILLQGLRTLYYMDCGSTDHLPWTSKNLYDWIKSKISGINISDTSNYSYCCDDIEGGQYIVIAAQDEFNRDFDREWLGISGNIALYAHEARHVAGYYHVSCCGIGNAACDQKYDENDLSAYGIQAWLNRAWFTGQINIGIGCLSSSRIETIVNWHYSNYSTLAGRFCDSSLPVTSIPNNPGGMCMPNQSSVACTHYEQFILTPIFLYLLKE